MPYPIPYDTWGRDIWKKRGPIQLYGIFKIENGQYFGYTENSFSMGWEKNKVRVWLKKDTDYQLKANKNKNIFLLRLTRTNSPIICDFKTRHDQYKTKTLRKYDGRNVGFVMNPNWKF